MDRRRWLRVAGGGFIGAALAPGLSGCSGELPAQAVAAWQPPPESLDLRRWAIAHALLAPNAHNLQSWRVDLDTPDTIVLHLDMARLLPATDPHARQSVISQGTFVELLDLAARQRGHATEVALFPEGEFEDAAADARPTARIALVPEPGLAPDPLFRQIFLRHTNRAAYQSRLPDAGALQAMASSVAGLPVTLGWVTPSEEIVMARLREIAEAAWRTELHTPQALLESYKVMRIGPDEIAQHRDGLSLNDPLTRAVSALGLFDRSRASAPDSFEVQAQIRQFKDKIAKTPAFLWLKTDDNARSTQLLAGRAYARLQLMATAHGLAMHPLSQALQEYPEQAPHRQALHALLGATEPGETVQMWARLGYAPPASPAPRRGLAALA